MAKQCARDPGLDGIIQKGNICHTCGKGESGVLNSNNSCQSCVSVTKNHSCIFCPIVLTPKVVNDVASVNFATLKSMNGELKCSSRCNSTEIFTNQKDWEQHVVSCVHAITDNLKLFHNGGTDGIVDCANADKINLNQVDANDDNTAPRTKSRNSIDQDVNRNQIFYNGPTIKCACKLLFANMTSFYNHRVDCTGKYGKLSPTLRKTHYIYECECSAKFVNILQVHRHMEMCEGPLCVVSPSDTMEDNKNEICYAAVKAEPDEVVIKKEIDENDSEELSFKLNIPDLPNERVKRSSQIFDAKTNAPVLPVDETRYNVTRGILGAKKDKEPSKEGLKHKYKILPQVAREKTCGPRTLTAKDNTPLKHTMFSDIQKTPCGPRFKPTEAICKPSMEDHSIKLTTCPSLPHAALKRATDKSSPSNYNIKQNTEDSTNTKMVNEKAKINENEERFKCECGKSFGRITTFKSHQKFGCRRLGDMNDTENDDNETITEDNVTNEDEDPDYNYSSDTADSDDLIKPGQADDIRDDPDFEISKVSRKRSPNKASSRNKKPRLDGKSNDVVIVDDLMDENACEEMLNVVNTALSVTDHELELISQRESANIKWIDCRFCNRKFTEPHHVLSHEGRCGSLHGKTGETVFCCHCSKTRVYPTPRLLAEHEKDCWIFRNVAVLDYNANPLRLKCMLCKTVFLDEFVHKHWANCKMRTKHVQDNKMYPCKFCGYIYYNPLCLGHHQMQCKEGNLYGGNDNKQSSRVKCQHCNRIFFKQQLKKHMKRCELQHSPNSQLGQSKPLSLQSKVNTSESVTPGSQTVAALVVKGNINGPITLQLPKMGPITNDTVKILQISASTGNTNPQINVVGKSEVMPLVNNISSSILGQQSTTSRVISSLPKTNSAHTKRVTPTMIIPKPADGTSTSTDAARKTSTVSLIQKKHAQPKGNLDMKGDNDVEVVDGNLHLCIGCGKSFPQQAFLEHQKSSCVPASKVVGCRVCMTLFLPSKENAYNKHCVVCSLDTDGLVVCTRCGDAFPSQKELDEHEVGCLETPRYECFLCERLLRTQKHLEEHTVECSTDQMKCQLCAFQLVNAYQWLHHEDDCVASVFHVICMYCKQTFKSKEMAKKHLDNCDKKSVQKSRSQIQVTCEGKNRLKYIKGKLYTKCESSNCTTEHYIKTTEAKLLPNIDKCISCLGETWPCLFCGNGITSGKYSNVKPDGSVGLRCINCYFVKPYSKLRQHHCSCLKEHAKKRCRGCAIQFDVKNGKKPFMHHEIECQSKLDGKLHTCFECFTVFQHKCELDAHKLQCEKDKSVSCKHCLFPCKNKRFKEVHERLCYANHSVKTEKDDEMEKSKDKFIHVGEFAWGKKIPDNEVCLLSEDEGKDLLMKFKISAPESYSKCFSEIQNDEEDDFEAKLKAMGEAVENIDEQMMPSNKVSESHVLAGKTQSTDENTVTVKDEPIDIITIKDEPIDTITVKDEPIDVDCNYDADAPEGKALCLISTPYSLKDVEDDSLDKQPGENDEEEPKSKEPVKEMNSQSNGHITTDNSRNVFQKCPCCSVAFTSEESIVKHWVNDCAVYCKAFCRVCGAGSRQADTGHIWYTHSSAEAVKHSTERHLYVCPVCQRFYTKPKLFLQHREMHLKNKILYVCNMCKVCLNDPGEMQKHAALEHPLLGTIACSILKDNKTDVKAIQPNIKDWYKTHNQALLDAIMEAKHCNSTFGGSLAWHIQNCLTETHNQIVHQIYSPESMDLVQRLKIQLSTRPEYELLPKLIQHIEYVLNTLKYAIEFRLHKTSYDRDTDKRLRKNLRAHYVDLIRFFENQNVRTEGIPLFHGSTIDAMRSLDKAAKETTYCMKQQTEDQKSGESTKSPIVIQSNESTSKLPETILLSEASVVGETRLVHSNTTPNFTPINQKNVAPSLPVSVAPSSTQVATQTQVPAPIRQLAPLIGASVARSPTQVQTQIQMSAPIRQVAPPLPLKPGSNMILVPVGTLPGQSQPFVAVPVQQCQPAVLPARMPLQFQMVQSTGTSQASNIVSSQPSTNKPPTRMPTLIPKPGLPNLVAKPTPHSLLGTEIQSSESISPSIKSEPIETKENPPTHFTKAIESPIEKEAQVEPETPVEREIETPMETDTSTLIQAPLPNIPGLNPAVITNPAFGSILQRFQELNENIHEESDRLGLEVQRRLQEASRSSQPSGGMSLMNFMSLPSQINFSDDESESNDG
ncbi:unnamed protein product [Owenia fusiformis]|uniref:C2H2-type domain-containing protein n=1 Tax=Owenia fusiformis TaxID=6347 RepID=A0A8S4MUJ0_OWEFU|nr:unnamed protein product [Owenia fusiformis]